MPGYDAFPLQDGEVIHERLKCYHCQLVLKEAVQTKESAFIVCRECFDEALKNNKSLHPGDRDAWLDNSTRKEVAALRVLCLYHEVGCKWRGLFKDYFEHIEMCEYRELYNLKGNIESAEAVSGPDSTEQVVVLPMGDSYSLHGHVQDRLTDEFTKMSEAFKEMTVAYHLLTNKVLIIEKRNSDLEKKVEKLMHLDQETLVAKAKVEDRDSSEASRSSPHLSARSVSSCEITSLCVEQSVLHPAYYSSIHYENHTSTVNVKVVEDKLAETNRNIQSLQEQFNSCNAKAYGDQVSQYEEIIATYKALVSELEQQSMFTYSVNGEYVWPISDVNEKISDARSSHRSYIESPPFYTGRNGYKMCIRAYLNGYGSGERTHFSIFFVIMKGKYDPLLQWPFKSKVSLILVDQDHKKHLVQTFKPNGQSISFQMPKTDMNVASGCPEFADLSILENLSYVKDDVMYIKVIVDTSEIFHP